MRRHEEMEEEEEDYEMPRRWKRMKGYVKKESFEMRKRVRWLEDWKRVKGFEKMGRFERRRWMKGWEERRRNRRFEKMGWFERRRRMKGFEERRRFRRNEKMGWWRRSSDEVAPVNVEEHDLEEGEFVVPHFDDRVEEGVVEEGEVEEGEIVDEGVEMEEGELVKPDNVMEGSEPEEGEIIECESSLALVPLPHSLEPIGALEAFDFEEKPNISKGYSDQKKGLNVRESFDFKQEENPCRELAVLPENLYLKRGSGQSQVSYPKRRVSAHRVYPEGFKRSTYLEYSKFKSSCKGKFSERNKIVRANVKEEVMIEDWFKEKLHQGKGGVEHVHARKDFDGMLKEERDIKPQVSNAMVDGGIKSSCGHSGMKFLEFNKSISLKRKSPWECVDERHVRNQLRKESVLCLGLMSRSNCPWRKGKQTTEVPKKLTPTPKKSTPKKNELVLWDASKSISRKRNANQDYSPGHNERYGGCYLKRNRKLSLATVDLDDRDNDDDHQGGDIRSTVRKALRLFQTMCRVLTRDEEQKPKKQIGWRVDLQSATILKANGKWVHLGKKMIGDVPGVEVGDEFHYRVELAIVGLHSPYQGGIDTVEIKGKRLATSIVASGGYEDYMDSSDVLVYSGQGGTPIPGSKLKMAADQKLERGNLALKNSMDERTPVRVIRGFKETLIYDGLYFVEKYWMQQGGYGNKVFMFQLRRKVGQPELAIKELKKSKQPSASASICVKDISCGKEKMPIRVINTIDEDEPPTLEYITKMVHPLQFNPTPHQGCECIDGCLSSMNCLCAVKNGGKIPYNYNGAMVEPKSLIFECGPNCRCPSSCYNRVSQHGIKFPLEIFRTKFKGWGVRSLTSIPSGSFLCEYTGELLQESDAEQRVDMDEYLFDIGRGYDDHSLWEGLSDLIPSEMKSGSCEKVEEAGFTIDAANYGNVARFINHSCSPNLYAHNVLYDHNDKRMPHIMLFAVENIPPLKELTYHYNMGLDQVYDSDGNIKKKKCYCGSSQCRGRLY